MKAMLCKSLLPDVITYSARISACVQGELLKGAFALLEAQLSKGLLPAGITYSARAVPA